VRFTQMTVRALLIGRFQSHEILALSNILHATAIGYTNYTTVEVNLYARDC